MNLRGVLQVIQGWVKVKGASDGTMIGNVLDRLKVDASVTNGSGGGLVEIDFDHYQIHRGRSFIFSDSFALGLNAEKFYSLTTPNTTRLSHFGWQLLAKGEIIFRIHEGVTCTEGTTINILNSNRDSTTTSVNVLKNVSAVSNYGTQILINQNGAVSSTGSGGITGTDEIILKRNTKYLFYIKSLASSNNANPKFRWYEYDYTSDT